VAAAVVDALVPGVASVAWNTPSLDLQHLCLAAVGHGVEGLLRERAHQLAIDVPGVDEAVHTAQARHQRALRDLAVASGALDAAGIDHLVVKGPAVARLYAVPSLRSYVDLDLVVAPDRLRDAVDALETTGHRLLDANWPMLSSAGVHELAFQTPTGGALDLHWSLGPSPIQIDHSPRFSALWGRSAELQLNVGGLQARALGDADAVVHLAVHAAASGGNRLVWLADLRAALEALAPTPISVRATAKEWGAEPALDLMMARLARTLRYEPAIHYLSPGLTLTPWRLITRLTDQLSPVERSTSAGSAARVVARSARHTEAASLAALATKSARHFGGLVTRDRGLGDLHDPTDPRSARFPDGGAAARAAFFRQVAQRPS
jgi:hypothetical protein